MWCHNGYPKTTGLDLFHLDSMAYIWAENRLQLYCLQIQNCMQQIVGERFQTKPWPLRCIGGQIEALDPGSACQCESDLAKIWKRELHDLRILDATSELVLASKEL